MINKLHRSTDNNKIEPEEGQLNLLCSNKALSGCPSLGFIDEEDQALDYLAKILVEAFIKKKKDENRIKQQKSSNILPCVNQRTG